MMGQFTKIEECCTFLHFIYFFFFLITIWKMNWRGDHVFSFAYRVKNPVVAFSTAVRGGVRYTALSAIQICGCPHSTTGYSHFSLRTPIPECMCTGQQLSAAHTTVLGCRESPYTFINYPHNRFTYSPSQSACCTDQQLSAAHTTVLDCRESPYTFLNYPHNRFPYSPSQSACAHTNSCLRLRQPFWAAGNPP